MQSPGENPVFELNDTGKRIVQELIQFNNMFPNPNNPTINDLCADEEWVNLFNRGYIYVGNMSPDVYQGEGRDDRDDRCPRSWYFAAGVERAKLEYGYEYGNPNKNRLKYPVVAVFAKMPE